MGITEDRPEKGLRRRELLRRAGVLGAAAAVPAAVATAPGAAKEREQLQAFAAQESDTLNALLARLIPTDAAGPGATEARVGRYIDRQLAGEQKATAPLYEAGLAALDDHSRSRHGAPFTQLAPAQQDSILGDVEAGTAPGFVPDSATFFALVREHALQGMFGDPVHGGNADFAGWDLLGYPGVKLNFTRAEQRVGVRVRRAHRSTADYELFETKGGKASGHGH